MARNNMGVQTNIQLVFQQHVHLGSVTWPTAAKIKAPNVPANVGPDLWGHKQQRAASMLTFVCSFRLMRLCLEGGGWKKNSCGDKRWVSSNTVCLEGRWVTGKL